MREKVWSKSFGEEYLPQVIPGRGLIRGYARLCSTLLLQAPSFPLFRSFRSGYKLLLRRKSPLPTCAIRPVCVSEPDSRPASQMAARTVSGEGTLLPSNPQHHPAITPTRTTWIRLHALYDGRKASQ